MSSDAQAGAPRYLAAIATSQRRRPAHVPPGTGSSLALAGQWGRASGPTDCAQLAAPFPRSGMPASIETSVKLVVSVCSSRCGREAPSVAGRQTPSASDKQGVCLARPHTMRCRRAGSSSIVCTLQAAVRQPASVGCGARGARRLQQHHRLHSAGRRQASACV